MNRSEIIKIICSACCCDEHRAEEYLDAELLNLHELRDAGDLRYDDLETACSGLGSIMIMRSILLLHWLELKCG